MSSGKEQTSLTNEGCVPLQTIQCKINYRPNPIKSQSPSQEFILIFKATYNSVGKSHPATHVANNQTVLSTKNQTENPAGWLISVWFVIRNNNLPPRKKKITKHQKTHTSLSPPKPTNKTTPKNDHQWVLCYENLNSNCIKHLFGRSWTTSFVSVVKPQLPKHWLKFLFSLKKRDKTNKTLT